MKFSTKPSMFTFIPEGLSANAFFVATFSGKEQIGRLYTFDLEVLCDLSQVDLQDMYDAKITFKIHDVKGEKQTFICKIKEFELQNVHANGTVGVLSIQLVHDLYHLELMSSDTLYMGYTPTGLVEKILKDALPNSATFKLKNKDTYPEKPYFMTYEESLLQFITRLSEEWGIYYAFETDEDSGIEKIVFYDDKSSLDTDNATLLPYREKITNPDKSRFLFAFSSQTVNKPAEITIKGYDYKNSSTDLKHKTTLAGGFGNRVIYRSDVTTEAEANLLSTIESDIINCGSEKYTGESTVVIKSGQCIKVESNPIYEDNTFLLTEVTHYGQQIQLLKGRYKPLFKTEERFMYRNEFTAISTDTQFRLQKITPTPEVHGHLPGRISTLDNLTQKKQPTTSTSLSPKGTTDGRYFVQLFIDTVVNDKSNILSTAAPMRLIQSFAGNHHGFCAPLQENDEVMVSFLDNHPHCPVITGIVPNSTFYNYDENSKTENRSIHETLIESKEGNEIKFSDEHDEKGILLKSEHEETRIAMGDAIELLGLDDVKKEIENEETTKTVFKIITYSALGVATVLFPPNAILAAPILPGLILDPTEVGMLIHSKEHMKIDAGKKAKYTNGDSYKVVEEIAEEINLFDRFVSTFGYNGLFAISEVELELDIASVIGTVISRGAAKKNLFWVNNIKSYFSNTKLNFTKNRIINDIVRGIDTHMDTKIDELKEKLEELKVISDDLDSQASRVENTVSNQIVVENRVKAAMTEVGDDVLSVEDAVEKVKTDAIQQTEAAVRQNITSLKESVNALGVDGHEIIIQ